MCYLECSQWSTSQNIQKTSWFLLSSSSFLQQPSSSSSLDALEITAVAFVVVNNNCSILAVGWDKHVNVYNDDREQIKQICHPDDEFCKGDDVHHGHFHDILCIDKSQGDLIATGDYGGTIIVSNLSSKMIFVTLKDKQQERQRRNEDDSEGEREREREGRREEEMFVL